MSYSKPRRISIKDTVAHLKLPDTKSLFMLRAACKRGALPCKCPTLRQGRFIVSEVDAFKIELDAIIAQSNHPPSSATQQPTNSSTADRRANPDRRGGNRG